MNDVQSRIVVMGIDEPQSYFKTVNNGLEKYGAEALKKVDLDIDEVAGSLQNRKNSMIAWLNPSDSSKNRELSSVVNKKKRPSSSVSSSGAAGGKRSERSNAETTTLATQGVTLTDL